ncbi:SEL1-like repeat protein [Fluviibacter phosphoraccumulans]
MPTLAPQPIVPYKEHCKTLIGRGLAGISEDRTADDEQARALIARIFYEKGLDYYLGRKGKTRSYNDAFRYFDFAATFDNFKAQYRLAEMYQRGDGVETSIEKAMEWLQLSAERGYGLAQARLGSIYEFPFLYELNIDANESERLSLYWTEKAATSGESRAQNKLAHRFMEGRGVSQSYEQAAYWFETSSINGSRDSFSKTNSQINLACMCLRGLGVESSVAKAVDLLESAAANESRYSHHAEHILGDLYLVAQRYEDAFRWYIKAAQRKHPLSLHRLGLLYEGGFGVAISYKEAFDYYQKAVDRKHPNATTRLGLLYERGLGVQQNYKMAFDLYQIAAERGCSEAYLSLAAMYKDGLYVDQSDEMAYTWCIKMKEEAETCEKKIRKYERFYKCYYYE